MPPASPLFAKEVERIAASIARYEPDAVSVALVENHWEETHAAPGSNSGPADPGPFTEHLLAVPGFIGEVMAFTLATAFRPQPVLALGAALALLGTLTGRKVRDDVNTRTNVYCLGVSPPEGARNAPAWSTKKSSSWPARPGPPEQPAPCRASPNSGSRGTAIGLGKVQQRLGAWAWQIP